MGTAGWIVVAVLLATAWPVAGAVGTLDAGSDATDRPADGGVRAPAALAGASTAPAQETPGNNSSVAHRDPDEVADESAPGAVEEWLAREVGGAGGVDLSDEDRRRARELVESDPELADLAAQYGEGAGDRQVEGSDALGAAQRQFFADVQRYRDAHGAYERAREGNRTDRERRLAHRLERHAAAVNRSARLLDGSDAELGSAERVEEANRSRTVARVRDNVTASQVSVRDRTLVRTRLNVIADDPSGSFADPVRLAGQLRTADGDPLANETVTVAVGGQVYDATTDATGGFAFDYRPTLDAAGERDRTVWFLPANDSAYRRASDAVTFAVERVSPTVAIATHTESVGYGDPFRVAGTVAAGGEGVPNVPVAVTVDGVALATVATDANGSFDARAPLPANVSAGERRVRVRLAVGDSNGTASANDSRAASANRAGGPSGASGADGTPWSDLLAAESDALDGPAALAPANASASVSVESTPTELSISRVEPLEASAFVTGRLVAGDGAPVANETVALRVDGASAGNVSTDDAGRFAATVGLPSNETDGSALQVVAAFASPGNLDRARATARVPRSSADGGLPVDPLELGVAGLLGVAAVGVAVWRFRTGTFSPETGAPDDGAGERESGGAGWGSPEVFLDAATAALDDGAYDAAAGAAYASVRRRLAAGEAGVDRPAGARTHWEFYADCRAADLSADRLERLERLTAIYERAAFAPESVSADEASEAVDVARSVA